ncbi:Hypothetical Protein FCC1311_006212 [Hondaea fermentalgiana]|uniref:Uncharacterized protein n=1 Tax=Hondaea fermentalgiana TaxID=2315210 RepID=A0A2R5G7F9_9STRA|nr:Hypothetical Protein FCC1311_006212 [Hondaea fermentalgiana]|eukprot:GBG24403.1 Hypothetical Protein FCC1311_006212 [Hondaea fermentalgiana]
MSANGAGDRAPLGLSPVQSQCGRVAFEVCTVIRAAVALAAIPQDEYLTLHGKELVSLMSTRYESTIAEAKILIRLVTKTRKIRIGNVEEISNEAQLSDLPNLNIRVGASYFEEEYFKQNDAKGKDALTGGNLDKEKAQVRFDRYLELVMRIVQEIKAALIDARENYDDGQMPERVPAAEDGDNVEVQDYVDEMANPGYNDEREWVVDDPRDNYVSDNGSESHSHENEQSDHEEESGSEGEWEGDDGDLERDIPVNRPAPPLPRAPPVPRNRPGPKNGQPDRNIGLLSAIQEGAGKLKPPAEDRKPSAAATKAANKNTGRPSIAEEMKQHRLFNQRREQVRPPSHERDDELEVRPCSWERQEDRALFGGEYYPDRRRRVTGGSYLKGAKKREFTKGERGLA